MSSELTSNFEVAESPCEQLERLKMAQQGREEVMLSQQEVILKYAGKMNELRMVLHLVESKLKVSALLTHFRSTNPIMWKLSKEPSSRSYRCSA